MAQKVYNPHKQCNRRVRRCALAELERLFAVIETPEFRGKASLEIGAKDGRLFGPKVTIQRITAVLDGSSEEEPGRD